MARDGLIERAFVFDSGGRQLSGIVHEGATAGNGRRRDTAILFANAGSRGRLGNTFQYPFYARQLSARGYSCVRFDPHGIGDSQGVIETREMPDWYGTIQAGVFVDDTLRAIEEARAQTGAKRVVLFGICGGAITSLMAGARSEFVNGLVLLSAPVLRDSAQQNMVDQLSSGYAAHYLQAAYGKKIFSLKAWSRLISGKSEWKTISTLGTVVVKGAWEKLKTRFAQVGRPELDAEGPAVVKHEMFNDLFLEAMEALVGRDVPMLLLFGEGDPLRWDFEEQFKKHYWGKNPAYERLCETHYLAGCNHLFTLREWQRQALDRAVPWFERWSL
jgi:pimeloyl-ACP methyl ester carboxylesterase